MKKIKSSVLTALSVVAFAKPNQAAPKPVAKPLKIFVVGKFAQPGSYEFSGQRRVIDVMVAAGGLTASPASLRLHVSRHGKSLPVNVFKLLVSADLSQNLPLQSGDILIAADAQTTVDPPVPPHWLDRIPQPAPKALPDQNPSEFFPKARLQLIREKRVTGN